LRDQLGERLAAVAGADFAAPIAEGPPPVSRKDEPKGPRPDKPRGRRKRARGEAR